MSERSALVLAVLLSLAAVQRPAAADAAKQAEILWTYRSPGGERDAGVNIEEVLALPDGSVALTVSESPNTYYLYRLDPSGQLTQRVDLGAEGGDTAVDHALAPILPPVGALSSETLRAMTGVELPIIGANSGGQAWRVSADGRIDWRFGAGPSQGLWVTTSMGLTADGSVLLGGRGEVDGGRSCGDTATIVRLDRNGDVQWRWRFELPGKWTYVTQILVMQDDTILARIDTQGPGAEMGSPSNGCSERSRQQWLAWLAADGTPLRATKIPYEWIVGSMALIPIDRIVVAGEERSTGHLFFRILSPDGEHVHLHRVYEPRNHPDWPKNLTLQEVEGLETTDDKLFIFVSLGCDNGESCTGEGLRALAATCDGRFYALPPVATGSFGRFSARPDGTGYLQLLGDRVLSVPFQ